MLSVRSFSSWSWRARTQGEQSFSGIKSLKWETRAERNGFATDRRLVTHLTNPNWLCRGFTRGQDSRRLETRVELLE